jgi:hypothetical protein
MSYVSKRLAHAAQMWGRDVDEFVKSAVNSFGNNMFIMAYTTGGLIEPGRVA